MVNLYSKATKKLIHSVVAFTQQNTASARKERFEEFAQQFFRFSPSEDLESYSVEQLSAIANDCYQFLQKRAKGTPKIRVFNPTQASSGWTSDNTVIELINDDMPFLVDSITEEINRHGLSIYQLIHPVMDVERNKKNEVATIAGTEKNSVTELSESVMHFQVTHIGDARRREALLKDLERVLEAVYASVSDWQSLLAKTGDITEELSLAVGALDISSKSAQGKRLRKEAQEVQEFIHWLKDNNFVFLGYAHHTFKGVKRQLNIDIDSLLGVCKVSPQETKLSDTHAQCISPSVTDANFHLIHVTKSNNKSLVHRPVHMDHISIRQFDAKGNVIGEHCFLGTFTSIVYHQSTRFIPIIREKIEAVRKKAEFSNASHNGKNLIALLEDFPRDELFQTSEESLLQTALSLVVLTLRPSVKLFVRRDDFERFMSCIIYVPRDRMNTELRTRMEAVLKEAFGGTVSNHYTQISESHLARLQVIIKTKPGQLPEYDVAAIEAKLAKIARLWVDELSEELKKRLGEQTGRQLFARYHEAFSVSYINRFSAEDAFFDILKMQKVIKNETLEFDLYRTKTDAELQLKIYHPERQIVLSEIMPILENMGISTIDEHTYLVTPQQYSKSVCVHRFRIRFAGDHDIALSDIKQHFEEAIDRIWAKQVHNDALNKLIVHANLPWRDVVLIRAYSSYLQQMGFAYSQQYVHDALGKHPAIVRDLVAIFYARFDPKVQKEQREKNIEKILKSIKTGLSQVEILSEDKVIRSMLNVMESTLRTNFFQKTEAGDLKSYISFKINSSNVQGLPEPRPYAEIFVYSPRVEGIHLRGGKVARGGLRWSDRQEDFRTEILGLMKAQMTKNSVIIPVGSKGGFVVKQTPKEGGREALMAEAVECYKTFLRGLLDITDNLVADKVKAPKSVVRYDENDPYLVVAADKGTASFSDIANGVAAEYNFWLGDGFASGGSVGYDHKKMGITARGAWVSVTRHFREMGLDVNKDDFTVVGVGDMMGDVFGNGMLSSPHIRLVGAFNHMHIFVDPNPDAAKSFKERQRLFKLPRSTWLDYDKKLISKGGAVFERSAKSLQLSKEIQNLLDIDQKIVTPDELIRLLLKSRVDLLWNGGIGTYVKSSKETHDVVGDKANDAVRIDGNELRAKVVGEGGNLGLTQLGRIECARNGVRINTDSIDNSAGVDCSDHEVNIKIALDAAVSSNKLSLESRHKLLEEMTDEVAELVLRDNRLQTQAISIEEHQAPDLLEMHARLTADLEKRGLLNRSVEFLPTEEEYAQMHVDGMGLTRPRLSVLMAYSKLTLYQDLIDANIAGDSFYSSDLTNYFPARMHKEYLEEIQNHPLRQEIVVTIITNSIINRLGSTGFFHIKEDTGASSCDIARCYTITREVFDLRDVWADVEALDGKINPEVQMELFVEVIALIERVILWFLRNNKHPINIGQAINNYILGIRALSECLEDILPEAPAEALKRRFKQYRKHNIPEALAKKIAGFEAMASACDIVEVSRRSKLPVNVVGKVYFKLGAELQMGWMRRQLQMSQVSSYWQRLSINTLIDDLFDQQKRLAFEVIKVLCKDSQCDAAFERWVQENSLQINRYNCFINDLKSHDDVNLATMVVAVKKVKEICAI